MVKWIRVDSSKITKIGYNSRIETMYIDFNGSITDTPYKKVSEKMFKEFSMAKNVDGYFDSQIRDYCEEVTFNTENSLNCNMKN